MLSGFIPPGVTFILGAPTRARSALAALIVVDVSAGREGPGSETSSPGPSLLWNAGDDATSIDARLRALSTAGAQVETHFADELFDVNRAGATLEERLGSNVVGVVDSAVLPGLGIASSPRLLAAQLLQYRSIANKTQAALVVFIDTDFSGRINIPPMVGRLASAVYVFREERSERSDEEAHETYRLDAVKPPRQGLKSVKVAVFPQMLDERTWTERAEWRGFGGRAGALHLEGLKAQAFAYLMQSLEGGPIEKTKLFADAKEKGFYGDLLHETRRAHEDKIRSQKIGGTGYWFRPDVSGERLAGSASAGGAKPGSIAPNQARGSTGPQRPRGGWQWRGQSAISPLPRHVPLAQERAQTSQGAFDGKPAASNTSQRSNAEHAGGPAEVAQVAEVAAPKEDPPFSALDVDEFCQYPLLTADRRVPSEEEWISTALLAARSFFAESGRELSNMQLIDFVIASEAYRRETPDLRKV